MMLLFVFCLYVRIVVYIYSHKLTLSLVQMSHGIFNPNLIVTYVEAWLSVPNKFGKVSCDSLVTGYISQVENNQNQHYF
jgi:hypothetical protein